MPKMIEVDTRELPGNGGTVTLWMPPYTDEPYEVRVTSYDGQAHTICVYDRAEAVSAFYHPFAYASTPDMFQPQPEPVG